MPLSLPLCFFGACEVCGVSCVFAFCFSSFTFLSVSKNARSFFLLEVILGAGSVREGAGPSVRVHSIRWVYTTVVFMKNWSVSMVLEATSWRSASVFASFSLCDVQYIFEGLRSLGPIVAAGSILHWGFWFLFGSCERSASGVFSPELSFFRILHFSLRFFSTVQF